MRKTITAILATAIAAAAITAATLPASASAPVNWRQRTCTAFSAYRAHPTAGRLTALVTDSTHLAKSYLKADAFQLAADASSPSAKAAKYAAKDVEYLASDCAG